MKLGPILLLLFLASTASAQVDDRLFADYVRRVVQCCGPGRTVVVFYHSRKGDADTFLDTLGLGSAATAEPLDSPATYTSRIDGKLTGSTVAVAYNLDPDAVRILTKITSARKVLSISSTEDDVYMTSLSFDSEAPDRFRSREVPACIESCPLNFHLLDKLGSKTSKWRAGAFFLKARNTQRTYKGDRNRMIDTARLLQHALRYESKEQVLPGEWADVYTPHVRLGQVFLDLESASNEAAQPGERETLRCEAAKLEWQMSSEELLKAIAPQALVALREGRQRCPP